MCKMRSTLYKEIYIKDLDVNISINIEVSETKGREYCIKNFIVYPISPLEAELIAEKFHQNIVWYYLKENKIVFYPKKARELCYSSISDLENMIVNSLVECISIDISRAGFLNKIKGEFDSSKWLIDINDDVRIRRSFRINSRLMVMEAKISNIRRSTYLLEIIFRIYFTSHEENTHLLNKMKSTWRDNFLLIRNRPSFSFKLTFRKLRDWETVEKIKELCIFISKELKHFHEHVK